MSLQAVELEEYLIEKGAKDLQPLEEDGVLVRLYRIIDHCHLVFSATTASGKITIVVWEGWVDV